MKEISFAIANGVRCICLYNLGDNELLDLKKAIDTEYGNQDNLAFFAKIRPEEDFPIYHEIDLCWALRDAGFSGVWPSPEAIYGTGFPDIYSNILAMKSKASRLLLSPRQFLMDRRREGATEYLGNIEI